MMVLVCLVLALLVPGPSAAQPTLAFESEYHDFGPVDAESVSEHTFSFVNSGSEDLIIEKLVAT